ncbi:MAG TPA: metal-sensitive transcriptional regulator, partial [Burkholderiaceae bacterium]|nr:metal-sensitive transcriptional regulator [Burkholderiaceae bacterium]
RTIWHTAVRRHPQSASAMTKKTTAKTSSVLQSSAATHVYRQENEKDMVNRLRRIEGQVRGLVDMIESGRSCEEVATQMSATRKAMEKAFYRMMTCSLIEAVQDSQSDEQAIQEVERSARLMEKFA